METQFKKLWSSFAGFRKIMAICLKEAGAPLALCSEVGYIDCEDAGVASDVFQAYEDLEYEFEETEKCRKKLEAKGIVDTESDYDVWESIIDCGTIHDCVINMYSTYENPWNYPPGHRAEKIDKKKLAENTVEVMLSRLEK